MLSRRFIFAAAAIALVWAVWLPRANASAMAASELLDSKVEYVADFYLTPSNQGTYRGGVIHAHGRERRDFDTAGGRQSLLLRRDTNEAAMLWPERKWYVSTSFAMVSGMVGGFEDLTLDMKKIGKDTISGEVCTRYEVAGSTEEGGDVHGRMWVTRDGIVMKFAATVRVNNRDKPVELGLLNLRRVAADPSAFVLPADYKGIPLALGNLGNLGK